MTAREELIANTFLELADTLVAEFDVIDFLHTLVNRTVALIDADAAGIMLADQRGGLEVLAASRAPAPGRSTTAAVAAAAAAVPARPSTARRLTVAVCGVP